MSAPIDGLERMAELSERMLAAAGESDWDRLVELERQMRQLRDGLGETCAAEDDATLLRKARLVENMLRNQQRIIEQVRPWMDDTRKLLADGSRDRAVRAAYGAHRY
jgi:flagellar protein FliT